VVLKRLTLYLVIVLLFLCVSSGVQAFAQTGSRVDLILDPAQVKVKPGDTFEVTIKAAPSSQELAAMDVFLDFDPQFLEVVDSLPDKSGVQIKPGTVLTQPLSENSNRVDNSKGEIDFGAGMPLGKAYSEVTPLTVATVTFKTKPELTGSTEINFHDIAPRQTMVAYVGANVLGTAKGASVNISEPPPPAPPAPEPPAPPAAAPPPAPASPSATQPPSTPAPAQPAPAPAPAPATQPSPKPAPAIASQPAAKAASKPAPAPAKPNMLKTVLDKLYAFSDKVKHLPWWAWIIIGLVIAVGLARAVVRILIKTGRLKVDE
jgi:hypothetical protein